MRVSWGRRVRTSSTYSSHASNTLLKGSEADRIAVEQNKVLILQEVQLCPNMLERATYEFDGQQPRINRAEGRWRMKGDRLSHSVALVSLLTHYVLRNVLMVLQIKLERAEGSFGGSNPLELSWRRECSSPSSARKTWEQSTKS